LREEVIKGARRERRNTWRPAICEKCHNGRDGGSFLEEEKEKKRKADEGTYHFIKKLQKCRKRWGREHVSTNEKGEIEKPKDQGSGWSGNMQTLRRKKTERDIEGARSPGGREEKKQSKRKKCLQKNRA